MGGLKTNITKDGRLWIDQYPDGSLFIIDDGENWETDRIRISLSHNEMMKMIGVYFKEHDEWQEEIKEEDDKNG